MQQDLETGEILYISEPVSNTPSYDTETGEPTSRNYPTYDIQYDDETGEPDINKFKMHIQKRKFNIPKEYLTNMDKQKPKKCRLKDSRETFTLSDKERVIGLKEEIILGCNKTSHRMFLIPSLLLYSRLAAFLIIILEIFLHMWAHRKNYKNTNPNVYYRSPLHILSEQFCTLCRLQYECDHIGKLQERSQRLHNQLKHVTRTLG